MQDIKIFTNSTFNETIKIEKYLEPVTFHVVLGMNFFADFLQSFTDVFGGKSESYQKRLESINKEVIDGIKKKVQKVGGNAAIDLRIDNDEISAKSKSMIMVTAIATAVIINEKKTNVSDEVKKILAEKGENAILFEEFTFQSNLLNSKRKLEEVQDARSFMQTIHNYLEESLAPYLKNEVFNTLARVDVNPSFSFTFEIKENIKKCLANMDYEERSEFLYSQFVRFLEFENLQFARKAEYIYSLIIDTFSVNYELTNKCLLLGNENLRKIVTGFYFKDIDQKPSFTKGDIIQLKKAKDILVTEENPAGIAVIDVMIDKLDFIFNKT